jgi:hypothetical protein
MTDMAPGPRTVASDLALIEALVRRIDGGLALGVDPRFRPTLEMVRAGLARIPEPNGDGDTLRWAAMVELALHGAMRRTGEIFDEITDRLWYRSERTKEISETRAISFIVMNMIATYLATATPTPNLEPEEPGA